jgi:hypothetical protein
MKSRHSSLASHELLMSTDTNLNQLEPIKKITTVVAVYYGRLREREKAQMARSPGRKNLREGEVREWRNERARPRR